MKAQLLLKLLDKLGNECLNSVALKGKQNRTGNAALSIWPYGVLLCGAAFGLFYARCGRILSNTLTGSYL
ncbi:hypothetical protein EMCRGX_G025882 [Ephydatia muelleri]